MTRDRPAASPPGAPQDPAADRQLSGDLAILRGGAPAPQRRRRSRWLVVGLPVLLVALAGIALFAIRAHFEPPEVRLVAVANRDLGVPPVLLTASGHLEARRQITLSSKAQGKILEMPVEENQRVAAGDLIAHLENDEQRANLALADAEFADAGRELRRTRQLRERGTTSQAAFEAAETAYRVAEARRDLAQVALDNTVLRAPIDGTVIRKIRDVGEFLTIGVTAEGDPGTAVVTLADLSAIDVALQISETEIRKVKLGAPVVVTPEALPGRNDLGDVIEIAAMADRQKAVVPVKVRIRQPTRELLPDMTAKVRFLEREPDAAIETRPAVPVSAVVEREGQRVVFVVEGETATSVPVQTREIDTESLALIEGPELGAYVVEAPPPQLRSGDAIRVSSQ